MPDVIFHQHAVQTVIAAPKPPWMDYTPSSMSDDFSHTNAVVTEVSRTAIFISGHDGPATGLSPVTLGVDVIGSQQGDTGSFRSTPSNMMRPPTEAASF